MRLGDCSVLRVFARKHGCVNGAFFYGDAIRQFDDVEVDLEGDVLLGTYGASDVWQTIIGKPAETQAAGWAYERIREALAIEHSSPDLSTIVAVESIEDARFNEFNQIITARYGILAPECYENSEDVERYHAQLDRLTPSQIDACIADVRKLTTV